VVLGLARLDQTDLSPALARMRVSTQDELISEITKSCRSRGCRSPGRSRSETARHARDRRADQGRSQVYGSDYSSIEKVSVEIENALKDFPSPERLCRADERGSYLDFAVDRDAARDTALGHAGPEHARAATGGKMATTTVEGRRRFTVLVPTLATFGAIRMPAPDPDHDSLGAPVPIGQVATIQFVSGPPMSRTRTPPLRPRLRGHRDLGSRGFRSRGRRKGRRARETARGITLDCGPIRIQVHAKKTLRSSFRSFSR